jgi:Transposase and inactivated derivatives
MIPRGVEIFVALDPIDLRFGFDRLCGIVTERLGRQARSGALFVFFGRRRTAAKILFCDRTGICVFYKRLDAGTYRIPDPAIEGDVARLIDERAFDDLIDGIDVEAAPRRRRVH